MKAMLRKRWFQFLRYDIARHGGCTGAPFKLRAPHQKDIVQWVNEAWSELPGQIIMNGFIIAKLVEGIADDVDAGDFVDGEANDVAEVLLMMGECVLAEENDDDNRRLADPIDLSDDYLHI